MWQNWFRFTNSTNIQTLLPVSLVFHFNFIIVLSCSDAVCTYSFVSLLFSLALYTNMRSHYISISFVCWTKRMDGIERKGNKITERKKNTHRDKSWKPFYAVANCILCACHSSVWIFTVWFVTNIISMSNKWKKWNVVAVLLLLCI